MTSFAGIKETPNRDIIEENGIVIEKEYNNDFFFNSDVCVYIVTLE